MKCCIAPLQSDECKQPKQSNCVKIFIKLPLLTFLVEQTGEFFELCDVVCFYIIAVNTTRHEPVQTPDGAWVVLHWVEWIHIADEELVGAEWKPYT